MKRIKYIINGQGMKLYVDELLKRGIIKSVKQLHSLGYQIKSEAIFMRTN